MKKFISFRSIIYIVISLVAIGAIVSAYYFYSQYQRTQSMLKNPAQATKEENKDLVGKVGKLIQLPSGEEPTIATVSDKNKLKDQAFFNNTENGDKVLIYTQAKKAILYRPSTDKIIEVATLNLGNSNQESISAKPVNVTLYNGTKIAGLAKTIEKQLKEKITGIEVIAKDNAKGNYAKNFVIDVSGNQATKVNEIAKELNAEVTVLPKEEVKPQTDILVILGESK